MNGGGEMGPEHGQVLARSNDFRADAAEMRAADQMAWHCVDFDFSDGELGKSGDRKASGFGNDGGRTRPFDGDGAEIVRKIVKLDLRTKNVFLERGEGV